MGNLMLTHTQVKTGIFQAADTFSMVTHDDEAVNITLTVSRDVSVS